MRSPFVHARFNDLALVLCVGLGACQSPTDLNGQLDVTVAVDRTEAAPTKPADITITIRNRGPDVVDTADPRSYACWAPYQVLDSADRPVLLPGRLCALIGYPLRSLAPGDSVTVRDRWSADMTDGKGGATTVAAGQYRIVARVFGQGREFISVPVLVTVPLSVGH
jgi:hypothetical protein